LAALHRRFPAALQLLEGAAVAAIIDADATRLVLGRCDVRVPLETIVVQSYAE
jgi:hypothetical protein